MRLYIYWLNWGLRWKITNYRLCEKSFEAGEIVIGPFWLEWDKWV